MSDDLLAADLKAFFTTLPATVSEGDLASLGQHLPAWNLVNMDMVDGFELAAQVMALVLAEEERWDVASIIAVLRAIRAFFSDRIIALYETKKRPSFNNEARRLAHLDMMHQFDTGYSFALTVHDRHLRILDHAIYPGNINPSDLCCFFEGSCKWEKHQENWFFRIYIPTNGMDAGGIEYIDKADADCRQFTPTSRRYLRKLGFVKV
jgi:hypothetical protein